MNEDVYLDQGVSYLTMTQVVSGKDIKDSNPGRVRRFSASRYKRKIFSKYKKVLFRRTKSKGIFEGEFLNISEKSKVPNKWRSSSTFFPFYSCRERLTPLLS